MSLSQVSPQQAKAAGLILDVCEPAEHEALHIPGAVNVPLSRLAQEAKGLDPAQPYVLACRSGKRAQQAAQALGQLGFAQVQVLAGGLQAWEQEGLPVVRGEAGVWPVDRQVRVVVGASVLLGSALGWLWHPYAHGLAAFMGAGVLVAGLTDSCAMAMFLARMPWNQRA